MGYSEPLLTLADVSDAVSRRLLAQGYALRRERLNPKPYSKCIGHRIEAFEGASIVFRVEDEGKGLLMVHYELCAEATGLRSAFRGFTRFLDWLVLEDLGVERLYGGIEAMTGGLGRGLPKERIAGFYKKVLCGQTLKWEHGTEWVYTEMEWWRQFRGLQKSTKF